MSFAENLKNVRKERGITQEQLAELLSVSRQAVSRWESGSGYPETEKLLVIARELDVSLDYLLLDEIAPKEKTAAEPAPVVYAAGGKISIRAFDGSNVVLCSAVRSSRILAPAKNEPRYILSGVDKVTFWGEHTTILGWYASGEDVRRETEAISAAISEGRATYELQFAADVEFRGLFGSPRIKAKL